MMICHYDNTNSSGGLEKQARMLARSLRAAGEDVVVLGSTRKFSRARWSDDEGVPVRLFWTYTTPQISGRYLPAALLWAAQLLFWVFRNRAQIDLIHVHQLRIHAFVAAIARKFWSIQNVLKSATGGAGADIRVIGTRKYFGAAGRRFVIAHGDHFVATTRSIEEDLLEWGVPAEKVIIIPNGLSVGPAEAGDASETRARRFLFLGRLDEDKNVTSLAAAAADMPPEAKFQLDFYGAGDLEAEVEAISRRDPAGRVRFCGWHSDPDHILGRYGYLLLPSNAEGLSNAMLEAMARGVVPVTTRVSGCVDHITPNENGLFLEGVDHASLYTALSVLTSLPAQEWSRLSSAASNYARVRFDMDSVRDQYRALYARFIR